MHPLLGDHVPHSGLLIWGIYLVAGLGSHWAGVRGTAMSNGQDSYSETKHSFERFMERGTDVSDNHDARAWASRWIAWAVRASNSKSKRII